MSLHCCDLRRLELIRREGTLNGIESLEVRDHAEPDPVLRQRTLLLRLLRPGFAVGALRILGGERLPEVPVQWFAPGNALPGAPWLTPAQAAALLAAMDDPARTLVVRTASRGDFSRYTLSLLAAPGSAQAPAGFDGPLARIAFSFKVECPSELDCAPERACPPEKVAPPRLDYLAKDYPSIRRLLLERMSLLAPTWGERSAADVGMALVELMAYAGDNLSYRQDALTSEAYLGTARRRISLRRHATLVDYRLHEGCNARCWVSFEVALPFTLTAHHPLLTRVAGLGTELLPASPELARARSGGALQFETMWDADLHPALNRLSLYSWGEADCCLPAGSTRATLRGDHSARLRIGDFLLLEQTHDPGTGLTQDADPASRQVVRLVAVRAAQDAAGALFDGAPLGPLDLTEVEWDLMDALRFPLCLSRAEHPGLELAGARGNLVLADQGETLAEQPLQPPVPTSPGVYAQDPEPGCEQAANARALPLRYRPLVPRSPLTRAAEVADLLRARPGQRAWAGAAAFLQQDPRQALPSRLSLRLPGQLETWTPRHDLLLSNALDRHCVAETENDGAVRLRFGDDQQGQHPPAGAELQLRCRIGNGQAGAIGANSLAHLVSPNSGQVLSLDNPLPASGWAEPEGAEALRRDAPQAFRRQERAVTPADYAEMAARQREVQRGAASLRWTGAWRTVFVSADRRAGRPVDAAFQGVLRAHLEPYRMAAQYLAVRAPRFVALDIALHVCVQSGHAPAAVRARVAAALSARRLPGGELGHFHPDRLSFGQPVYLSPLLARVQGLPGVLSVVATRFQRLHAPDPKPLLDGLIAIGPLEVAQCEQNPNFRDRGRLVLELGGGQ